MALGHWLKDYIGPHSGGSGGGGTEPLIIHVTEEEVKEPQTQKKVGYKTDVLASDAYEAWQNGVSIYCDMGIEGEWLVFSVGKTYAYTLFAELNDSLTLKTLRKCPDDGYLYLEKHIDDEPIG